MLSFINKAREIDKQERKALRESGDDVSPLSGRTRSQSQEIQNRATERIFPSREVSADRVAERTKRHISEFETGQSDDQGSFWKDAADKRNKRIAGELTSPVKPPSNVIPMSEDIWQSRRGEELSVRDRGLDALFGKGEAGVFSGGKTLGSSDFFGAGQRQATFNNEMNQMAAGAEQLRAQRADTSLLVGTDVTDKGITYAKGSKMDKAEQRKTKARELMAMDDTLSARRAHEMAGITNLNQRKAMTDQWKAEDDLKANTYKADTEAAEKVISQQLKGSAEERKETAKLLNEEISPDIKQWWTDRTTDPAGGQTETVNQERVDKFIQIFPKIRSANPQAGSKQGQITIANAIDAILTQPKTEQEGLIELFLKAHENKNMAVLQQMSEDFGVPFHL